MLLQNLMSEIMILGAGSALGPQDFSYSALFMRADIMVKLIMGGLAIASIWSWAIIIDKTINMHLLKKRASNFEETFWSGRTLDELSEGLAGDTRDPMGRVFTAAMREYKESKAANPRGDKDVVGTRERIDRVMGLVVNRELSKAERGMTVLATIGSASVFVGLFGTVWGIMNSFRAIALSQNTNLAVVARVLRKHCLRRLLALSPPFLRPYFIISSHLI